MSAVHWSGGLVHQEPTRVVSRDRSRIIHHKFQYSEKPEEVTCKQCIGGMPSSALKVRALAEEARVIKLDSNENGVRRMNLDKVLKNWDEFDEERKQKKVPIYLQNEKGRRNRKARHAAEAVAGAAAVGSLMNPKVAGKVAETAGKLGVHAASDPDMVRAAGLAGGFAASIGAGSKVGDAAASHFQYRQKKKAWESKYIASKSLEPLWKADPGFVALAKQLYGDDVSIEQVAKDLFGKMDPTPSDVHIQQPAKVGRKKKKELVVDERAIQGVGKSFVTLVEKAFQAGLIDKDGNLNEKEIKKSRQYVRDHAGRFAASGAKTAAHIAATGVLAGTGAILAAKSPKMVEGAAKDIGFVTHHMTSSNPVERHVARSLLPYALKTAGKATGTAGAGAVTSAGAVYEGTKAYEHMRAFGEPPKHPVQKDWKEFDAKRKSRGKGTPEQQYNRGDMQVAGGVSAGLGGAYGGGLLHEGAKLESTRHYENLKHAKQRARLHRDLTDPTLTHGSRDAEEAVRHVREGKQFFAQGMQAGKNARNLARASRGLGYGGLAVGAALTAEGIHNFREGGRRIDAKKKETASKSHDVTWEGEFSKVDEDKRQIFGWASVTQMDGKPVIDLQGDYIHPDDMEKAAYDYVLKSRVGGDMHTRVDEYGRVIEKADQAKHVSDLIESMVFTPEKCEAMGIDKSLAGSWWTGFQVNDPDLWGEIKSGKRTGFSIHGAGMRKSIDVDELDPESELIGKAYQESENLSQLVDNLATIYDVTGLNGIAELAKHLHHGIQVPQINAQQGRNAGVFGSLGSAAGGLTGAGIGLKFGHPGEGAAIGAGVGGLTGTTTGIVSGKPKKPQRPPSVESVLGTNNKEHLAKSVATTNRQGGAPSSRQEMYKDIALQQATERLAPQVAAHIQAMQQQQWQQQMMEQQQMAMMAQQQPQDFSVKMGPYPNHQNGNSGSQLTPSQNNGEQQGGMTMPTQFPSAPTMQ